MSISSRYYNTRDAAEYLGYKPCSIRRFVREGKLIPTNAEGRPRFTQAELDRFAHRGRIVAPAVFNATVLPTLNASLLAAMGKK
jgi:hypothetical protein